MKVKQHIFYPLLMVFCLSTWHLCWGASCEEGSSLFSEGDDDSLQASSSESRIRRQRSQSLGEDERREKVQTVEEKSHVKQDLSMTCGDSTLALALSCFQNPHDPIFKTRDEIEGALNSLKQLLEGQGLSFHGFTRFDIFNIQVYLTKKQQGEFPTEHLKLNLKTPQSDPLFYFYQVLSESQWQKGPVPKQVRTKVGS